MKTSKNQSFSIIEMLVVITVILIIISLLFPFVQGIQNKARGITCKSNLRQIGALIFLYTQDHEGVLPGISVQDDGGSAVYKDYWNDPNYKTQRAYWSGHIAPYFYEATDGNWNQGLKRIGWKNGKRVYSEDSLEELQNFKESWDVLKVFVCPSAHAAPGFAIPLSEKPYDHIKENRVMINGMRITTSYVALGEFFGHTYNRPNYFTEKRLKDIMNPDQKMLLFEGDTYVDTGNGRVSPPYTGSRSFAVSVINFDNDLYGQIPHFLHDRDENWREGNMNSLFADLSVRVVNRDWLIDDPEIDSKYWHNNYLTVNYTGKADDTMK